MSRSRGIPGAHCDDCIAERQVGYVGHTITEQQVQLRRLEDMSQDPGPYLGLTQMAALPIVR